MIFTFWRSVLAALALASVVVGQEARHNCTLVPFGCEPDATRVVPVMDAWSDLYSFTTPDDNGWLTPIHATLLPTEEIFFLGLSRDAECPGNYPCQPDFNWRRHAWTMPSDGNPLEPYVSPNNCYSPELTLGQFRVVDNIYDNQRIPLEPGHDLFCSGQTLTADGHLFMAGGTFFPTTPCPAGVCGLSYGMHYNRFTGRMRRTGNMLGEIDYCPPLPCKSCEDSGGSCPTCPNNGGGFNRAMRWYPTCTRLYDGRILITGGLAQTFVGTGALQLYEGLQNNSIETYDPRTRKAELILPSRRNDRLQNKIINQDYTHVTMLPEPVGRGEYRYDVLMFGQHGVPIFLDLDENEEAPLSESTAPGCRPQSNCPDLNCHSCSGVGVATATLPLRLKDTEWGYSNGSVIMAGGAHDTSHQRSFDVYDPVQDRWSFSGARRSLDTPRHHPSTVLLPTGEILVVGGHSHDEDQETLKHALYIDPRNQFSLSSGIAPMGQPGGHGYHAVSLLLPDGRVLLAGGRDQETDRFFTERPTFEYLYPPYFSKKRMRILVIQDTLRLGQTYEMYTDKLVEEVVLIGLGSMTHSFDMNQRYVQVRVKNFTPRLAGNPNKLRSEVTLPRSSRLLPPGYYMLFALDEELIPSPGRIVHVGPL